MKFHFRLYVKVDGVPTFRDSDLAKFYDRICEQEIDQLVFHDGSIITKQEWVESVKSNGTLFWAVYTSAFVDPVGLIWVNRMEKTSCEGHFVFFKEHWGTDIPKNAGRKFLTMIVKHFPVVMGVIPSWNKCAIKYCLDIGMTKLGKIPNGLYCQSKGKPIEATVLYYAAGEKDEGLH